MSRALGLDVGTKAIGVSLSDALGLAAHPLTTLTRRGTSADVSQIAELVAAHEVADVVVGLPLALDGSVGPRARRVRVLVAALRQGLAAQVHEWDERFSTVAVERVLIEADLSRRRRKEVIDRQAAVYILQGWLDARRPRQ
jgi:putative Holliday junction resolvase